jgi:hypothetical protein
MRTKQLCSSNCHLTNFPRLHDVARHIIHSNETLDVALETVDSIIHEHTIFVDECRNSGTENQFSSRQAQRRLYIQGVEWYKETVNCTQ